MTYAEDLAIHSIGLHRTLGPAPTPRCKYNIEEQNKETCVQNQQAILDFANAESEERRSEGENEMTDNCNDIPIEALKAVFRDIDLKNAPGGSDKLNVIVQVAIAKYENAANQQNAPCPRCEELDLSIHILRLKNQDLEKHIASRSDWIGCEGQERRVNLAKIAHFRPDTAYDGKLGKDFPSILFYYTSGTVGMVEWVFTTFKKRDAVLAKIREHRVHMIVSVCPTCEGEGNVAAGVGSERRVCPGCNGASR